MSFPSNPLNSPFESSSEDIGLLQAVLPPLLEDFEQWFDHSAKLLEAQKIHSLSAAQQQRLVDRVATARRQVAVAKAISAATNSQAGIDMALVMEWHKLVHECWGAAQRQRRRS
jgi:hypothetical protein